MDVAAFLRDLRALPGYGGQLAHDVSALAGKPLRLRFLLRGIDRYSLRSKC